MKTFIRCLQIVLFVFFISHYSNAQILVVQGQVTNNSTSLPIGGKQVFIEVDSIVINGVPASPIYSTTTTMANGYYIDSIWLPAGALYAAVKVVVYDCMNIPHFNWIMVNLPANLPMMNFSICNYPVISNDAGIAHLYSPSLPVTAGVPLPVTVLVRNYGTQTITAGSLNIEYQVNNGIAVVYNFPGSLMSGDSAIVNLSPVIIPVGSFNFCVRTVLPGDTNYFNDQICISGYTTGTISLPFSDNFDSLNVWHTDTSSFWQLGAPNGPIINSAFSGTNAWVTNLTGNYPNNSYSYLYSPSFSFSGLGSTDTVVLSFHHWMAVADAGDYGRVEYSINGGQTWSNLGFFGDPMSSNWYNNQSGGVHFFNYTNSGWMQSSYRLPPATFNGQPDVRFRFLFHSNTTLTSDGWAIDNVSLAAIPQPVSSVQITNILYPVSDTLPGTSIHPVIMLRNNGTTPLSMVTLKLMVDGFVISYDMWSGTMLPGDSALFVFNASYVVPAGPYQLCIETDLISFPVPPGNSILCRNFAGMVAPTGHLYGMLNTGTGAAGPCTVYLIQHSSPAGGTLTAIDTVLSIDSAGVTMYHFANVVPGNYYVKAAMLPANPNYAANIPTYHLSSIYWSQATTINVLPNAITQASIDFVQGINPGGPGFIGGLISQGANKAPGDPIEGAQIMLLDANNSDQPVAYAYSDAAGEFGFSNIPFGTYKIYAEVLDKATFPAVITIDSNNPAFNGVSLVVGSSVVTYVDENPGVANHGIGEIFPNPATEYCFLPLTMKSQSALSLRINDISGRVILSETYKLDKGDQRLFIQTANLNAGLYTLIIVDDNGKIGTRKLIVL